MKYRWIILLVAIALAALFAAMQLIGVINLFLPPHPERVHLQPSNAQTTEMGQRIYEANCASCHGVDLEGQPNWQRANADFTMPAPPHDETGHTWHHDDETLFKLTKYGLAALVKNPSQKSNMPTYEGVLEDSEITAVLSYIKSRWPDEVQRRHDQLNQIAGRR